MDIKKKLAITALLMLGASVGYASDNDDEGITSRGKKPPTEVVPPAATTKKVVDEDSDDDAPEKEPVYISISPTSTKKAVLAALKSLNMFGEMQKELSVLQEGMSDLDNPFAERMATLEAAGKEGLEKFNSVMALKTSRGLVVPNLKVVVSENSMANVQNASREIADFKETCCDILAAYYLSGELFGSKKFIQRLLDAADQDASAPTKKMISPIGVVPITAASRDTSSKLPQKRMVMPVKRVVDPVAESVNHATDMAVLGDRVTSIMSALHTKWSPDDSARELAAYSSVLSQLEAVRDENDSLPAHFASALNKHIEGVQSCKDELSLTIRKQEAVPVLKRFAWRYKGVQTRRLLVKQYKAKLEDLASE